MIWLLGLFSLVCVVTTLASYLPFAHGIVRVFDFPRLQNAAVAAAGTVLSSLLLKWDSTTALIIGGFVLSLAFQFIAIARFTPLWKTRSHTFNGDPAEVETISMLISNVKMGNRKYQPLRDLVGKMDADICVFMEPDQKWIDALDIDSERYPHILECPLDNAYGMYLVSKFPFVTSSINYLLNKEVPSFDVTIDHPDGALFRLITVHPEPPIPLRDTIGRDAELALVGELVRGFEEPLMVTGDLNDVAWSRSTDRFKRISRLLDPREGRGMYNTFHADYWFLRWPLDHIFHSPHFKLISIERMPYVESDHFPMFYRLALTETKKPKRETDEATDLDREEAAELIDAEKSRDIRPVGVDWEDS